MPSALTPTRQRIEVIDAFRGFALTGIVLVHFLEQFVAGPGPEALTAAAHATILDQVIAGLTGFLIRGKFFALFSLLFGLSFFLQMDRAQQRGQAYTARFAWRLTILLAIGLLHSLFYRGDILTLYAVLGFLLIPCHRLPNVWLLGLAAFFLLGGGRFVLFALHRDAPLFVAEVNDPNSPANQAYWQAIATGSLGEVFWQNLTFGLLSKAEFQFNIFGRGYLTLGFFLLGTWLGRIHFFVDLAEKKSLLWRGFWYALALTLLMVPALIVIFQALGGADGPDMNTDRWLAMLGLSCFDLLNLGLTALILLGFLLIYRREAGERVLRKLAPYGRTALSNYVFQSLIGTFLLFGWGLGYLGQWNNSILLLIAVAVLIVQARTSRWWLRNFPFGPLEWLWRSLTYWRWQSFRHSDAMTGNKS